MIAAFDPAAITRALDADGFAVLPGFVGSDVCGALAASFDDENAFRATIVMERHGYGRGIYRYFADPVPADVRALRERVYALTVDVANAWSARLGSADRYPLTLEEMLARCHACGQTRPTPLLLRYGPGDYNALHQDTYGAIAFPLQATVLLGEPQRDFTGGEFILVEGRARRQSVPHVVPLDRGDAVVFPNRHKPNARGGRSTFRHGVARVRGGQRLTLGLILHDAA